MYLFLPFKIDSKIQSYLNERYLLIIYPSKKLSGVLLLRKKRRKKKDRERERADLCSTLGPPGVLVANPPGRRLATAAGNVDRPRVGHTRRWARRTPPPLGVKGVALGCPGQGCSGHSDPWLKSPLCQKKLLHEKQMPVPHIAPPHERQWRGPAHHSAGAGVVHGPTHGPVPRGARNRSRFGQTTQLHLV